MGNGEPVGGDCVASSSALVELVAVEWIDRPSSAGRYGLVLLGLVLLCTLSACVGDSQIGAGTATTTAAGQLDGLPAATALPGSLSPRPQPPATGVSAPLPKPTSTPSHLSWDSLKNAGLPVEFVPSRLARLKDGVYEEAYLPGAASKVRVSLANLRSQVDTPGTGGAGTPSGQGDVLRRGRTGATKLRPR
jgi:hypothetical protein